MFKLKTADGKNNICGRNVARYRQEKNLSQRQLAKKMQLAGYDVDHHFIRRIENGQRFVTDIELLALSETLSVSIYDLVDSSISICDPSD